MNYVLIKEFFADYSLQSIVIALIFMGVKLLLEGFFKNKLSPTFLTFTPFFGALLTSVLVDMIIVEKAFNITELSICSAFVTATLSTVLTALVKRVFKGKKVVLDKTTLFLEELLSNYTEGHDQETLLLLKEILENSSIPNGDKKEKIDVILKEKFITLSEFEISLVSSVILDFKIEEN